VAVKGSGTRGGWPRVNRRQPAKITSRPRGEDSRRECLPRKPEDVRSSAARPVFFSKGVKEKVPGWKTGKNPPKRELSRRDRKKTGAQQERIEKRGRGAHGGREVQSHFQKGGVTL